MSSLLRIQRDFFERLPQGHAEGAQQMWNDTRRAVRYLGTWHSHPQHVHNLEAQFDQELKQLRARASELEQAEEARQEYLPSLSARYGRDRAGDPSSDVDGVFRTLVEQLER